MIRKISLLVWALYIITGCQQREKVTEDSQSEMDNMMKWVVPNESYAALGSLKLSEYGFFKQPIKDLEPAAGVLPYDLNSPLFTDYASKKRFIYIPEGTTIQYDQDDPLGFPFGTILIKNFYYTQDQLIGPAPVLIETRLLVYREEGWIALPYVWDEDQTEAFLEITGGSVPVHLARFDNPFEYKVPTMIQCKSCHEANGRLSPIGPTARQLNKDFEYPEGTMNQLEKMELLGWLVNLPVTGKRPLMSRWENEDQNILDRARAYLDINCGHCHRPVGPARNAGLDLTIFSENDLTLGIKKAPVAAGKGSGDLNFDIVPGYPDHSIMIYRMKSNDPAIMMPELGRSLIHREGIDLISNWIRSL